MNRSIQLTIRLVAFLMLAGAASGMTWPTSHPAPARDDAFESFVQPTVSGEPTSALFGCVRNNGNRFHEGLDIAPYQDRDRRGEATDAVVAAFEGRVTHINKVAGDSGYGRYVVLEHGQFSPAIYTLYAHLASVADGLRAGATVAEGGRLGIMGRSAGGYSIPRQRAHLHLEIGVRLTENFQAWYDRQRFGSKNEHGVFNGMNLLGLDPLDCYRWLRANPGQSMDDYYRTIPPGAVVEVVTARIPDFVRRYPGLLSVPAVPERVAGWRITFSGWGLPLAFEPLSTVEDDRSNGDALVVAVDPEALDRYGCRDLVDRRGSTATLGAGGRQLLELLFNFY